MRSTSSAHRAVALLLSLVLAMEWAGFAAMACGAGHPEPCILLKLSGVSVSEELARQKMGPLPRMLLRDLNVIWVQPADAPVQQDTKGLFPEADDASLERISRMIAEALKQMDRMETKNAELQLSKAESEARRFRLGGGTRPLFAEIFLRRGLLNLWDGKITGAEEMFARSWALRPGFTPDPALFSPAFREAWSRAVSRTAPEAEILVQSIPSGASISVDGKPRGTTPGRIRVASGEPVRIRISMAGYRDAEKTGQWLPGDYESLEWVLGRDRIATLGEALAESPDGKGTGKILDELASGSGASRVAIVVMLDRKGTAYARVLSTPGAGADPAVLGEFEWRPGEDGREEAARKTARMLRDAGWPATAVAIRDARPSWYDNWWILVLVGAIGAGVAAGVAGNGGKGGASGGSTGTIGVNF